jgi:hypothetical protein
MRVGFKCSDRKQVAVMLIIGHENKDGSEPLDLVAAMKQLGWEPICKHEAHDDQVGGMPFGGQSL